MTQYTTARTGYDTDAPEKITIDYRVSEHMKRIADALEEILRLVKKDQEESKKRWEKETIGE
jgi:hypothetical protein